MKWNDLLSLAAQNLLRRRMRTVLTVLGVIIGTACIILMVALGLSNIAQTEEYYVALNLNKIEVYNNNHALQLTDYTVSGFLAIPGVQAASPVLQLTMYAKIGKHESEYFNISCVDPTVLNGLELEEGTLFSITSGMPEIVLGSDARINFQDPDNYVDYFRDWDWSSNTYPTGPDLDWLNEQITLTYGGKYMLEQNDPELPAPRVYKGKFVGITGGNNYESYMSLALGKQIQLENRKLAGNLRDLNSYSQAIVISRDIESVSDIVATIKAMGYEAYSPVESIEMMQEEQARQQGQLLAIALISLLVSAIGIANTMLASILERKAEIGVMKVIGMSIGRIRALFLLEAAMIGLAGGITGSLLSYLFAFFVNNSTSGDGTSFLGMYFGSGMKLLLPFWLVLCAIGVAIFTGVISGIYPAYKATKMSPMEAIRG